MPLPSKTFRMPVGLLENRFLLANGEGFVRTTNPTIILGHMAMYMSTQISGHRTGFQAA